MPAEWATDFPVNQVRIARPTDQLDKLIEFYHKGLGLEIIGSFKDHAGYDGTMFGLPGNNYHLEFTQHIKGSPCPAPTTDNLLVFYLSSAKAVKAMVKKLNDLGYVSVPPENPYWQENSVTISDPDGWRIVLVNSSGYQ